MCDEVILSLFRSPDSSRLLASAGQGLRVIPAMSFSSRERPLAP